MHRRQFIQFACAAGLLSWMAPSSASGQAAHFGSAAWDAFLRNPPPEAYPQVYWFWMNGHISREGITADLEAMKTAGISGVFQFDAGTGIPKGPVAYGSDPYWALKKHALREALRLNLEVTLHNCPGWSASGGPWITPELSMQELTWSEMVVTGGKWVDISLPKPYHKLNHYRDVALLAFPAQPDAVALGNYRASTAAGPLNKELVNGDGELVLPPDAGGHHWLLLDFYVSVKASNISFQVAAITSGAVREVFDGERNAIVLEASQNGHDFITVATISTGLEAALLQGYKFITFDFGFTTHARFFRLTSRLPRRLAQVRFSALQRLPGFMEKAGFRFGYHQIATTEEGFNPERIDLGTVVDLSGSLDASGRLKWQAPPGNFTLLRLGHTTTGAFNKAAPEGGQGLECDKMLQAALETHLVHALQPILPELQELARAGKGGLEIDSFEAGMQNWTPMFPVLFSRYRGYSLVPYLPAITGRVVDSVATTENFLWDFRQAIGQAVADQYYGAFAAWCGGHGLTAYVEPYDKGPFSEIAIGANADVPMGEHWNGLFAILQGNKPIRRTSKLAASIAHAYGKKWVGAETFTSEPGAGKWQEYPFGLKAVGDAAFVQGVNKMVLHRFVHQPHNSARPGMTMGPWGSHIDRTNTWWPYANAWFTYLARCQWMLRQGQFVADIAYLAPEASATFTPVLPEELGCAPPKGYAYDVLDANIICHHAKVEHNHLVLDSGMRYRVLVVPQQEAMGAALLAALTSLVQQGLVLVAQPVKRCLGVTAPEVLENFHVQVKQLWGVGMVPGVRTIGKGKVYTHGTLDSVLGMLGIAPDCTFSSQSGDAPVSFLHRRTATEEIYWLSNARRTSEQLVCTFRVAGKYPMIVDPVKGTFLPALFCEHLEGKVRLVLQMEPYGSLFVVFTDKHRVSYSHLKRDSSSLVSTLPFVNERPLRWPQVADNFTLHCWVKPEQDIMLRQSVHMEREKASYTDYYAFYPAAGQALYGLGHATCGLAVGRNGVAVWENATGLPQMVLAVAAPIAGYTHVALVYRAGVPELFLQGKRVAKGKRSLWQVHPGKGRDVASETATYFNGDHTDPSLIGKPVDAAALKAIVQKGLPVQKESTHILLQEGLRGGVLLPQKGRYVVYPQRGHPQTLVVPNLPAPVPVAGAWKVEFPEGSGAPTSALLQKLQSLHLHPIGGVRHFSGTAVYTTSFRMGTLSPDACICWLLHLGRVEVMAEVILNGKNLGLLWTRPFRLPVTQALLAGTNHLEVRVTNLWPNRLIGDAQSAAEALYNPIAADGSFETLVGGGIRRLPDWYLQQKEKPENSQVAFTTWKFYDAGDPLLESGLIGPVILQPYFELVPASG